MHNIRDTSPSIMLPYSIGTQIELRNFLHPVRWFLRARQEPTNKGKEQNWSIARESFSFWANRDEKH